jgi:flagellar motor switch protein FliG
MSMLARYRKSGGFIQLLTLIETTAKAKQDNFMQMIEKEDPRWAAAIREKMITIEKIFTWENAVLAEIAARLQEIVLATVTHGLKPEDAERLMSTFSHSQKRMIDDLKKEKTPTPAEVNSGYLKMLTEVRNMITNGYIRVEKFAPEMEILKKNWVDLSVRKRKMPQMVN